MKKTIISKLLDKFHSYMTSGKVSFILFFIGIASGVILFNVWITDIDQLKILNKLFNIGLLYGVYGIYKSYFAGKDFDNEKIISKEPIAIAIDSGAIFIGTALVILAV